jgi:hypothetical protein
MCNCQVDAYGASLAELDPALPADIARGTPLAQAYRAFERAIDDRIKDAAITA